MEGQIVGSPSATPSRGPTNDQQQRPPNIHTSPHYKTTMADSSSNDAPHLSAFLQVRLVELGLDYDTYGPYVLGIEVNDDNDEDAQEEIEQVCQLLQASSESETDAENDDVWTELGHQIRHYIQLDNNDKLALQQTMIAFEKQQLQDQLALAKLEKQVDKQQPETSASSSTSKSSMDDAAKKAMLQRFAYEQDDDDVGGDDGGVVTNKQNAQQVTQAKAQELKSKKGINTKREEQIKTKDDRANKAQAKEDRKKRAVKGERKA